MPGSDSPLPRRQRTPIPLSLASPARFRLVMNLYPPLLFAGVRVTRVTPDWTAITVTHRVRPWNSNLNHSAFGGTLFAMTDPFYAVMAAGQLGPGHHIWNTTGTIEFLCPGRGTVSATMELTPAESDIIRAGIEAEGCSVTTHVTEIHSAEGTLVARAAQSLYVRAA
ncbi:DUF4442 domain-containing protein [Nocardia sp. NPDC051990]|uniref:DUF4442 domain-containing protein n=1 Tax=Nocardia sp. NPDC051990 TaxID=3155285 RepID=UPI003443887C